MNELSLFSVIEMTVSRFGEISEQSQDLSFITLSLATTALLQRMQAPELKYGLLSLLIETWLRNRGAFIPCVVQVDSKVVIKNWFESTYTRFVRSPLLT